MFLVGYQTVKAQGIVTFQENFFNNNRFKVDGKEAEAPDVARLMANFETTQKNFVAGHKQMRIGSVMRILSVAGLATGLVYGLTNDNDPNVLETYFWISLPSAALGIIGNPIRQKGKQRVETSISEYNYLNSQREIYANQVSLQIKSGGLSLVFKF